MSCDEDTVSQNDCIQRRASMLKEMQQIVIREIEKYDKVVDKKIVTISKKNDEALKAFKVDQDKRMIEMKKELDSTFAGQLSLLSNQIKLIDEKMTATQTLMQQQISILNTDCINIKALSANLMTWVTRALIVIVVFAILMILAMIMDVSLFETIKDFMSLLL